MLLRGVFVIFLLSLVLIAPIRENESLAIAPTAEFVCVDRGKPMFLLIS